MPELLARGPGRFWRGNLHCHSDRSDGTCSPAELGAAYRAEGYDFLVVSDHFEERFGWPVTDTRPLRTPGFTTLLGAELSAADWSDPQVYWVLAAGLPPDFAPPPRDDHAEAIRRAAAAGAFVALLHPGFNSLRPETVRAAPTFEAIDAVEICTHASSIYRPDGAVAWPFLEALLEDGHRLGAVAGDDAHFRDVRDGFGAWIEVFAPALEPDALLGALKAGAYYATQGPSIGGLALDGDALRVRCSPCARILLTGAGSRWRSWGWRVAADGAGLLSEATFAVDGLRGSFGRVTVVDHAGRRAWSNPIWL